jgi:uncharacterized membrane protein YozB (DUF420 family)
MTPDWVQNLPTLNAILNGTSATLLVTGYALIRAGRRDAHRKAMLGAFGASVLFLISYLLYHYHHGSTPFPGQGTVRVVYFFVLITHIVLAALIVPLALLTLRRGLRGELARHRRIARWALPVWLYVSVTGVVIYWMLYHLYRA